MMEGSKSDKMYYVTLATALLGVSLAMDLQLKDVVVVGGVAIGMVALMRKLLSS